MKNFRADMFRHAGVDRLFSLQAARIFRKNFGLQALIVYRLGRSLLHGRNQPLKWVLLVPGWIVYFLASRYVRACYGIRLELTADIGPGLYIGHFGGIVLRHCRLGSNCSVSQSTRILPSAGIDGPYLGDRVWVGAQAQVIGQIRIGAGSTISAAAVLRKDIFEGTLCMGNPARAVLRGYDNTRILNLPAFRSGAAD